MKPFSLILAIFCAVPLLSGQAAQKPAPTPKLTGFPFQNESLRYSVNWPSGLALGEVTLSARRVESGWVFDAAIDAGVPAFTIADQLHSQTTTDLCSTEFVRDLSHASRKTKERTSFDFHNLSAHRETLVPAGGGTSDFSIPSCPRDALAFFYFARQELGQGRVAPAASAYFGAAYNVELHYTGEMTIPVNGKPTVTDLRCWYRSRDRNRISTRKCISPATPRARRS